MDEDELTLEQIDKLMQTPQYKEWMNRQKEIFNKTMKNIKPVLEQCVEGIKKISELGKEIYYEGKPIIPTELKLHRCKNCRK